MASGSKKADYSHALVRNQEFDSRAYGDASTGASSQLFWDDPLFDDLTGDPIGIEGLLYGSSPWDRVALNNVFLPGLWEATATPAIQLDVQKPNGFDGAALVSRGYIPAGITITGQLWTPEQWTEFQRILPTFWARPNHVAVNDWKKDKGQVQGKQLAVTVDYPGLAAFNIHSLVIKQITPPEKTGDKGIRQIKIIATEYVPPPQKKQSAVKKVSGVGKDRSVQAEQILGIGSSPYAGNRVGKFMTPTTPAAANGRSKPSKSQARKT
jgi:hypothetical protein